MLTCNIYYHWLNILYECYIISSTIINIFHSHFLLKPCHPQLHLHVIYSGYRQQKIHKKYRIFLSPSLSLSLSRSLLFHEDMGGMGNLLLITRSAGDKRKEMISFCEWKCSEVEEGDKGLLMKSWENRVQRVSWTSGCSGSQGEKKERSKKGKRKSSEVLLLSVEIIFFPFLLYDFKVKNSVGLWRFMEKKSEKLAKSLKRFSHLSDSRFFFYRIYSSNGNFSYLSLRISSQQWKIQYSHHGFILIISKKTEHSSLNWTQAS